MTTFQRARSEEQRAERRRAILATAAAMLAELPVAQLTLNELSRRVRLAKSNVLNYFGSREAILLELLDTETREWIAQLGEELTRTVDPASSAAERGGRLADAMVETLASRPMLCALMSAQAAVLEHNISVEVALQFKRGSIANLRELVGQVIERVPELGEDGAFRFIAAVSMLAGALWTHAHPAAAITAVYEADPAVAAYRVEFAPALRMALDTLLVGVLPR
ncbi:TetR/AcrR family transcriptional regulator [Kribbella sp. CA-293567]|uniref:TetR/AcrR family transcriptional regulator n=1 Tax=Kribbella sp. CA-293567 TaxID=3002436 RepID=UPI0022DE94B3|nr:TetR/AcrR family transcriptional regulator [Kribbella sp. CA-293567]WBQ06675.1 TetR family transcriptional regulator [Kribbella sp. CA-293567]